MHFFARRSVQIVGLLALLMAVSASSTGAAFYWCKTDPVVDIGGKRAHIYVYAAEGILTAVTASTEVIISVPKGVSTDLISTDNGFGLGWEVAFKESKSLNVTKRGIQVEVEIFVPASEDLPAKAEITDREDDVVDEDIGETNRKLKLKTWL